MFQPDKSMAQSQDFKIIMTKTKYVQRSLWIFFERPTGVGAVVYHIGVFALILGSLIISILHTMDEFDENDDFQNVALVYELILLILFVAEYALRLWACGYVGRYRGFWGHVRFMFTLYMLIDIIVIAATLLTFVLHINSKFSVLRVTTFLQILRILRVDRKRGDLRLITAVIREHSKELFTCYFIGFIVLFAGSYVVYVSEKYSNIEDGILNMADGLYWAVITVTSVGYGDFSPQSWPGKYMAAVFALMGCAFFSLPAGILGSGFALQVNRRKKEKRVKKIRQPAAILIQSCWRIHMVRKTCLNNTWYALLPQVKVKYNHEVKTIRQDNGVLEDLMRTEFYHSVNSSEDELGVDNISFNPSIPSHEIADGYFTNMPRRVTFRDNLKSLTKHEHIELLTRTDLVRKRKFSATPSEGKVKDTSSLWKSAVRKLSSPKLVQGSKAVNSDPFEILPKYRGAIRFYLQCKYWIAVRQFKEARQPYVNIQDVLENQTQKHLELVTSIKVLHDTMLNMQKRMETLEKLSQPRRRQQRSRETSESEQDQEIPLVTVFEHDNE